MKILMVNTFNYLRGGAERCYLSLSNLLMQKGHTVIQFCMHHEKNLPSEYEAYFLNHIDFPTAMRQGGLRGKAQVLERVIYSREAKQKIEQLIIDTRPDIVHIHGIAHEISPSILPGIKKFNLPVVQTLHDYKLLCPNTNFISQGTVCEKCRGHKYYNVVRYRCKRGSLSASTLAGIELYTHKITQIYERHIDTFIAPSLYLQQKVKSYGIQNRVVHIPNFIELEKFSPSYESKNYFVYFGRLVRTKGLKTLLRAMKKVSKGELLIAGSGEMEGTLKKYCQEEELRNVIFLGHLDTEKITRLLQEAAFVVIPSEWYENYSMAVLEAFACGSPVIGARIGGIPEQVIDGKTGLLFDPGNVNALAEMINFLMDQPQECVRMGQNARSFVEKNNNADGHYEQTVALYRELMAQVRMR